MRRSRLVGNLLVGCLSFVACTSPSPDPIQSGVTVSASAVLPILGPQNVTELKSTVTGTINRGVTWAIDSGGGQIRNITGRTYYEAPNVTVKTKATIRATSSAASTKSGTVDVTVLPDAASYSIGQVNLPGSSLENISVLVPNGEYPVGSDGSVFFTVPNHKVGTVGIIDTKRAFGWTAVWPAWFNGSLASQKVTVSSIYAQQGTTTGSSIGPLSTAVQMIFSLPGLYQTDETQAAVLVDKLASLPGVKALAASLEKHAVDSDPLASTEVGAAIKTAFQAAIKASNTLGTKSTTASETQRAGIKPLAFNGTAEPMNIPQDTNLNTGKLNEHTIKGEWATGTDSFKRGVTWVVDCHMFFED